MLFTQDALAGIVSGDVDLAFRRWTRPAVRPGTRLRTSVGVVAVGDVEVVADEDVSDADARRAGFPDREALFASLRPGADRRLYRVGLRFAGGDPRIALRESTDLSHADLDAITASLSRMDTRSRHGVWTTRVLGMIAAQPGVRAPDLAAQMHRETRPFKADVRRLKELGLTESLDIGYRLSPRGRIVLEHIRRQHRGALRG